MERFVAFPLREMERIVGLMENATERLAALRGDDGEVPAWLGQELGELVEIRKRFTKTSRPKLKELVTLESQCKMHNMAVEADTLERHKVLEELEATAKGFALTESVIVKDGNSRTLSGLSRRSLSMRYDFHPLTDYVRSPGQRYVGTLLSSIIFCHLMRFVKFVHVAVVGMVVLAGVRVKTDQGFDTLLQVVCGFYMLKVSLSLWAFGWAAFRPFRQYSPLLTIVTIILMLGHSLTTGLSVELNGADVDLMLLWSPVPSVFSELLVTLRRRALTRRRLLVRQIEAFLIRFERRCELAEERFRIDELLAKLCSVDILITCYPGENDEQRSTRCVQVSGEEVGTFAIPVGDNPVGPWLADAVLAAWNPDSSAHCFRLNLADPDGSVVWSAIRVNRALTSVPAFTNQDKAQT